MIVGQARSRSMLNAYGSLVIINDTSLMNNDYGLIPFSCLFSLLKIRFLLIFVFVPEMVDW